MCHRSHKRLGWEAGKEVKHPACWPCSSAQLCTRSPIVKVRAYSKHTEGNYIPWMISSESNQGPLIAQTKYFQQDHLSTSLIPMCITTAHQNYTRRLICYWIHKTGVKYQWKFLPTSQGNSSAVGSDSAGTQSRRQQEMRGPDGTFPVLISSVCVGDRLISCQKSFLSVRLKQWSRTVVVFMCAYFLIFFFF